MRFKKLLTSVIATSILTSMMNSYVITKAETIMHEPVMKVTFDEGNALDVTGRGNNGTVVGSPEFVKGVKGKAIHIVNPDSVAGVSKEAEQYVNFGQVEDLKFGTDDFSIAFWYKSNPDQQKEGAIISNKNWNSGGNPGFNIGDMNQGINLNFNVEGYSGRAETDRFSAATDGKWHHIVAVVNRSDKMSLYIDGKEAIGGAGYQSQSYDADISNRQGIIDVTNFVLGADGNFKNSLLDSYIDELEVYKTALTKEEIKELAKYKEQEEVLEPVMKVTFDDENAVDLTGRGNDGTVIGSPEFTEGVIGKAIHLVNPEGIAGEYNLAQQYVDFGNNADLKFGSEDFSIMFWYKADGNDQEEVAVISNKDWYTGGNPGFAIGDMRNGMTLNFTANDGERQDTNRISSATDNKWHHIAATFNRTGNMILYVDGQNVASTNISGQVGKNIDVTNFILGADGTKRYGVNDSYIDELVVYKEVLSEEYIADINAPYILQNKIAEYEKLAEESTASAEKIAIFKAAIAKVKTEAEGVTDIAKIEELTRELKKAFNEFSGPEDGIIEFEVFSDVHISSDNKESRASANWIDAIKDVKEFFPNSSGIMSSGDLADSGYENQFKGFYDILDEYGDGVNFLNALGNHDVRWKSGWNEIYERYMRYNEKYMDESNGKVYHDKWIDGYHFIVLNTEWDIKDRAYISPEQLEWLDKTMAEGAEDGKPIFLFFHQAMRDTYWNSNDWDIGMQDFALKEVLRKYPQSIMFTGHIHNGLGKLDVVKTDYGAMVDVPGFYSNDYGDSRGQIGYHVSVYEDKVQLSMRDYKNDEWMPEYNYTIDLSKESYLPGKILDVNFDDGTAKDDSGYSNDGVLVGNPQFVEGIDGGKAIRINNPEGVAGKEETALQYVDFGDNIDLKFGEDDFSILFWYKSEVEKDGEGAIISNKNWTTGSNPGFTIGSFSGANEGIGLNFNTEGSKRVDTNRFKDATDGRWHQISATFDRDGEMTLYIDGDKVDSRDISSQAGKDIDSSALSFILGADGNKQFGLSDAVIDELKVYRKVLGAAELETVYNPYKLEVSETDVTISWEEPVNDETEPAYIMLNGTKYEIAAGEISKTITGLNPSEKYTAMLVTREKAYKNNFRDVYPLVFTTKGASEEVDKTALKIIIDYANDLKDGGALEGVVPVVVKEFNEALAEAVVVYNNSTATKIEVKDVFDRLAKVIHMLEFKEGDKSELENLINSANELIKEDYTEESWGRLEEVLSEANVVLDDENALQEEIDNVSGKLQKAIEDLEIKNVVDKSLLQGLVDMVTGMDKGKYIASTWNVFIDSLKEANSVLEDANATQEKVNESYTMLLKSYLGLRLTPDKSLLEGLIKEVEDLDLSKYTKKSARAVEKALKDANKVLANEEATQEEVDSALEKLKTSKNALIEISDNTSNTNNVSNSKNDSNTINNNTSLNGNKASEKLPKTGAVVSSAIILLIATSLTIGGVLMTKKKIN